jgi:hypothetical protein
MTRKVGLAALAACSVLAACADLFGFHDLRLGAPDAADAADDGYVCNPATWPSAPTKAAGDAGDAGPDPLTIALRHVYLSSAPDDAGGTPTFGYDLDNWCTSDPSNASCSGPPVNDQANGIDDESITLMNTLKIYAPLSATLSDGPINDTIAAGTFTILLRLLNYNGQTDVPLVAAMQVAVQSAPSYAGSGQPKFDGTDIWNAGDDNTVTSTSTYPFKLSTSAYVAKNVLVAHFTTLDIHVILPSGLVTGPLVIPLEQATLTGTLSPHGGSYDISNGLLVGRWAARDILGGIASLTLNGGALCDYDAGDVLGIVRPKVCADIDIRANGPDDNTKPCDAVSVAIAFDGVAAHLPSGPIAFPTSTTPCSHDAGDCN